MATADKQVAPLLGRMATDLPGCGTADKIAALERALAEFCRRSRCWREVLTVTVAEDATEADLAWPCGAYATAVAILTIDGVAASQRQFFRIIPSLTGNGGQAIEWPVAPVAGREWTLVVCGTLQPRRGEIDVPDRLLERYGDAIADGATALLKLHTRKPYSDPSAAAEYKRGFERGIADAACDWAQRERAQP